MAGGLWGQPGPMTPPLFILTCMRSYSSLVSTMLGQHSAMYCLPEVNLFIADTLGSGVDLLNLVRKRTLDGLYRAVAELEFGGQTEEAVLQAIDWVDQRRQWSPVQLMEYFDAKVAPRHLIEKSPSNVLNVDRLAQTLTLFPQARFLHLYRHPVATTSSIAKITQNARGGRGRQTKDPETAWIGANRAIIELSEKIPLHQFMALRGEDLLRDPDTYLRQICDWLGLQTTPADLEAMKHPEASPYAHVGPASAPFGADPGFLKHPHFVQRDIVLPRLDAVLDWAEPGRKLSAAAIQLSYQLGYS